MDTKTDSRLIMLFFFMFPFMKTNISFGADTIYANHSLSGDQTIVSAGGVFVLGFFHPGNSSNYYIGMWYKQVAEQTIAWVANREKPVSDRFSSELKISDGNLVLFDESKIPVWSTNVSFTSSSVQAVLLDNGNLVLNNGSNSSKPLWQSFDIPVHTWLPGNSIGYNKITKTKKLLTSWKNSEDPAPGIFSFELDPSDASYNMLWNKSRNYWTTGRWTGETFSSVPEYKKLVSYYKFFSNDREIFFTMNVVNSSTISRMVLDLSGQITQQIWLPANGWTVIWSFPRQQCEVYAFCGAYGSCSENSLPFCRCLTGFEPKSEGNRDLKDYSGGCIRKNRLQCGDSNLRNGESDKFLGMPRMSLPENQQFVQVRNITECESTCLNNCSCTAFTYDDNGCLVWMADLLDFQQLAAGDSSGRTLYIRLAASEFQSSKSRNGLKIIAVIMGLAAGLAVVLLLVFFILRRRKKTIGVGTSVGGLLVAFRYRGLQNATKNFSEKLGSGGFGSVFKGVLADSTVVAVKKLESVSQGEKQFRAEVSTTGTIQHVNLVQLRGFCSEGTKKLLVFDYMSNGSLDSHLFRKNNSNVLDWKTRYQIALGTARGLVYLHEKCRECIIHCDIKPENILLNAEFCPKVADFGLAKLVGRNFSRVLTTMRGTRGYLAPEWIAGVAITSKADVYSYGMMLFEIVSGRRNSEQSESDGKVCYFPSRAASVVVEVGNVLSLLDPKLEGNANVEELERICRVACWCIQDDEAHRPSMGQVVQIFEGIIEVKLPPVPRSLHFYDDNEDNVMFFTNLSSSQNSQARSSAS